MSRLLKLKDAADYCGLPAHEFRKSIGVEPVWICGFERWDKWRLDDMRRPGFVYFIQGDVTKRIKIGFSRDPKTRLRDLSVGSSENLTVIGMMRALPHIEGALHDQFDKYWVRGEWFEGAAELLAYIGGLEKK